MDAVASAPISPAPPNADLAIARQALANFVKELARRDEKISRGKRKTIRYSLNAPLKLGTCAVGAPMKPLCEAWGLNLSVEGIGMLTQQEFLPGRNVYLNLQTFTGCPGWVKLRIIFSEKLVGTMVRSGAAFVLD